MRKVLLIQELYPLTRRSWRASAQRKHRQSTGWWSAAVATVGFDLLTSMTAPVHSHRGVTRLVATLSGNSSTRLVHQKRSFKPALMAAPALSWAERSSRSFVWREICQPPSWPVICRAQTPSCALPGPIWLISKRLSLLIQQQIQQQVRASEPFQSSLRLAPFL